MPTYMVTDPTTGTKMRLTGDTPPSEAELNEIFASAGKGTTSPPAQDHIPRSPGQRVMDTFGKMWRNEIPAYRIPLRLGGAAVEGAMGLIGSGAKALGLENIGGPQPSVTDYLPNKPAAPPATGARGQVNRALEKVGTEAVGPAVQAVSKAKQQFEKRHPEVTQDIKDVVSIASVYPGKAATEALLKGPGAVAKAAGESFLKWGERKGEQAAAKATELTLMDKQIDAKIVKDLRTGIRPSVKGKGTIKGQQAYDDSGIAAVRGIIKDKENIQLPGPNGETVTGKLPESLSDTSSSIAQQKTKFAESFDKQNTLAGARGGSVGQEQLSGLVKELEGIESGKHIPSAKAHARKMLDEIAPMDAEGVRHIKNYTMQESQGFLAELNAGTKAWWSNPSYESASSAGIDHIIANHFRKAQYDVVKKFTGEGYEEARKAWGSLEAIENDVNRRMTVDARRNIKGFFDFSDMWTAADLARGIVGFNPVALAEGLARAGLRKHMQFMNDPNRIVRDMFRKADREITRRNSFAAYQEGIMGKKTGAPPPKTLALPPADIAPPFPTGPGPTKAYADAQRLRGTRPLTVRGPEPTQAGTAVYKEGEGPFTGPPGQTYYPKAATPSPTKVIVKGGGPAGPTPEGPASEKLAAQRRAWEEQRRKAATGGSSTLPGTPAPTTPPGPAGPSGPSSSGATPIAPAGPPLPKPVTTVTPRAMGGYDMVESSGPYSLQVSKRDGTWSIIKHEIKDGKQVVVGVGRNNIPAEAWARKEWEKVTGKKIETKPAAPETKPPIARGKPVVPETKPVQPKPPEKQAPQKPRTLGQILNQSVDPESLKAYGAANEFPANMMMAKAKGGRGLDEIATELIGKGEIPPAPEGKQPGQHLADLMKEHRAKRAATTKQLTEQYDEAILQQENELARQQIEAEDLRRVRESNLQKADSTEISRVIDRGEDPDFVRELEESAPKPTAPGIKTQPPPQTQPTGPASPTSGDKS